MGNFMTGYPTRRRQVFSVSDELKLDAVTGAGASGMEHSTSRMAPGGSELENSARGRSLRAPVTAATDADGNLRSASTAQCDIVDGEWMYNLDSLDREHKNRKKSHHHHGGGGNK